MHKTVYVMPTWTFFLQVEKSFRESMTFNVAQNIFSVSNCEEYESKMVSSNQVSGQKWRCCLMQNGTWNMGKPFPPLFFWRKEYSISRIFQQTCDYLFINARWKGTPRLTKNTISNAWRKKGSIKFEVKFKNRWKRRKYFWLKLVEHKY